MIKKLLNTQVRQKIVSFYFLIIAVPCGFFALFGDFMFLSAIEEEIANFNRRSPHSLWWFENYGFFVFYLVLINSGFLLLFGYARFISPLSAPLTKNNRIWILSLLYNLAIGGTNGWYAHAQGNSLSNPAGIAFWMVFIPFVGTVLSAACLSTKSPN